MKYLIFTLGLMAFSTLSFAQQEKEAAPDSAEGFTFSAYLEPYFSYDFSNPEDHERPDFFFSFNRHNEVNLNFGLIQAQYTAGRSRAQLGLMAGTYPQYNLAAEPVMLRHVFEANAGYKLSKDEELWIDAGIFPSHLGFESAIGKDNWTLTRSLPAENSPYYEAGIRLSYTSADEKWYLAALYLNGWQRITRPEGNNTPAFGTQLTFQPNAEITLNWGTFVGNDKPDEEQQWRYFNNFYATLQLSEKAGLTAGFDIGFEEEARGDGFNLWYTPTLIARFSLNDRLALGARAEYYADKAGVIVDTGTPHGFQTFGYSLNLDYRLSSQALFRIEGRALNSRDDIFTLGNDPANNNYFLTTSLGISL